MCETVLTTQCWTAQVKSINGSILDYLCHNDAG